uniref:Uncharacterized protein n=1 Tax=Cavia porcellus TaxID=10141 RepID=H0W1R7_CAVPO
MDKVLFVLLLPGAFHLVFFRAQATVLKSKGNCTVDSGPGCRTRKFFTFTDTGGWSHYHNELDCSNQSTFHNMYLGIVKTSTYCCKDQDLCNRDQGKLVNKNAQ